MMTRYEFICQHEDMLRLCAMAGVTGQDCENAEIYRFVTKLRGDGNKMDYCVRRASERYGKSEATVWRILRSLDSPVTITI
jgi:hypothetical protein